MDVTVVVATYGDEKWTELAQRAVASAHDLGVPVVAVHGESLHGARNEALSRVETEWVCHLDADDELEPGYFEAMASGSADLRAPSVRYVPDPGHPVMPRAVGHRHDCTGECLPWGNWLVVGSVVRTELVRAAGGWRDFDWCEDWDLWVRCWQAGGSVEAVPDAVYRAHVRKDSRNRSPSHHSRLEAHRSIARANGLPIP